MAQKMPFSLPHVTSISVTPEKNTHAPFLSQQQQSSEFSSSGVCLGKVMDRSSLHHRKARKEMQ